eukprot:4871954-Prymnesium_polylepis.1
MFVPSVVRDSGWLMRDTHDHGRRWRCGGLRACACGAPAHGGVGDVRGGHQRARGAEDAEGDAAVAAGRRGHRGAHFRVLERGAPLRAAKSAATMFVYIQAKRVFWSSAVGIPSSAVAAVAAVAADAL